MNILKLPTHMDGFLHPLDSYSGNSGVYSYVSKPKTVIDNYFQEPKQFRHYCSDGDMSIKRINGDRAHSRLSQRSSPQRIPSRMRISPHNDLSFKGFSKLGSIDIKRVTPVLKSKNKKSIISNANQKRIQFDKSQNTFEDEEADQKKTAGTPMSAIECKDQETQINFKDAACFVRLQEVDWMVKAMVSKTLHESLLDVINEEEYYGRA